MTPHHWAKLGITMSQDGTMRSAFEMLKYQNVSLDTLLPVVPELSSFSESARVAVLTDARYADHVEMQVLMV